MPVLLPFLKLLIYSFMIMCNSQLQKTRTKGRIYNTGQQQQKVE